MTLSSLLAVLPGARRVDPPGASDPAPLTGVAHHAGRVRPGELFCCLPGERADGHDFAAQAVAAGASALIVERPLAIAVPQIVVEDARLAMALAAAAVHGDPSAELDVIGVTGTNGKTTTAYLTHAIVTAAGRSCGLLGTVEARVGGVSEPVAHTTPESSDLQATFARMRDAGDDACAMEVSSHALVQRRVAGTRFAAAAFTNLTRDHLDYHMDVEDYFAAKKRLFRRPEHEGPDPPAAVNLDDPFGRRLAKEVAAAVGYAVERAGDVHPREAAAHPRGWSAEFATPRGPLAIESPLRGGFNLANIAAAIAIGELLALPHDAVAAGIAGLSGVPGRFEPIDAGQPFTVLVDYAHTPDSLENVLRAARPLARARLIVVFGCGGDRDPGKRGPMGTAARTLADVAIVTSDNPRGEDPHDIIRRIVEDSTGDAELIVEADRRAAIDAALAAAGEGDVVVVAGKGHEQGQEAEGVVRPFDDRDVVRELLGGAA